MQNIHGSMYDIHAACEEDEADDEHIEELEKLREISPSPEPQTKYYRRTDLLGGSSLLSQAPPESPDIKTRYSVKDEIAQLRYRVHEASLGAIRCHI